MHQLAMALIIMEDAVQAARLLELGWAKGRDVYSVAETNPRAGGILSSLMTAQALAHRTFHKAEIVLMSKSVSAEYPQHAKTAAAMYFMNPHALAQYTSGSDVGNLPTTSSSSSSSSSSAAQVPVAVTTLSSMIGGLRVGGQAGPNEGSILHNQVVSHKASGADGMLYLNFWESDRWQVQEVGYEQLCTRSTRMSVFHSTATAHACKDVYCQVSGWSNHGALVL